MWVNAVIHHDVGPDAVIHRSRVEVNVGRDMKPVIHKDVGSKAAVIHRETRCGHECSRNSSSQQCGHG
jgi:hypothetical protein